MATQNEGKDVKGRDYNQVTKDGSGSVASMGAGGTGDIGKMSGERAAEQAGNSQADARTDDLMSPDAAREQGQGFRPSQPEALKTGMEGIADANRGGGRPGNRQ